MGNEHCLECGGARLYKSTVGGMEITEIHQRNCPTLPIEWKRSADSNKFIWNIIAQIVKKNGIQTGLTSTLWFVRSAVCRFCKWLEIPIERVESEKRSIGFLKDIFNLYGTEDSKWKAASLWSLQSAVRRGLGPRHRHHLRGYYPYKGYEPASWHHPPRIGAHRATARLWQGSMVGPILCRPRLSKEPRDWRISRARAIFAKDHRRQESTV